MRADAFLPARSQPRVPTVDCDEVVLGDHLLHLQAQRAGKIPDEVDKIVAAFRELTWMERLRWLRHGLHSGAEGTTAGSERALGETMGTPLFVSDGDTRRA